MLKNTPTERLVLLWNFRGSGEDTEVFTNDVPRDLGEVFPSSHPGNGCWQSLRRFISQLLCPALSSSHSESLHLQCDWWSIFPLLHLAPNLAKVTGLTLAIPREGVGAAVDKLKKERAAWRLQTEHRYYAPQSNSRCIQERIIVVLNIALFTLVSFRGLETSFFDTHFYGNQKKIIWKQPVV